jgi:hypothetical protein
LLKWQKVAEVHKGQTDQTAIHFPVFWMEMGFSDAFFTSDPNEMFEIAQKVYFSVKFC